MRRGGAKRRGGAPGWSAHAFHDPHVALHHVAGQVLGRLLVAGRVVAGERLLQARELDQDHALIQSGFVHLRRVAAHEILAARGLDRRRRELRVGLECVLVLDRVITDNPIGLGHRLFLSLVRLDAEIPDDLTESYDVAPDFTPPGAGRAPRTRRTDPQARCSRPRPPSARSAPTALSGRSPLLLRSGRAAYP